MICNSKLTIYHKSGYDVSKNFELWTRYNYDNAWIFKSTNAVRDEGFNNSNSIQIRLPYDKNILNVNNFAIGDIIVPSEVDFNIETQQDLEDYDVYTITTINDNTFGKNKHIHIVGM